MEGFEVRAVAGLEVRAVEEATGLTLGCGEWGLREMPMEEHFRLAKELGFRYLEFGIGGGQVGRLPEQPSRRETRDFKRLADSYDVVPAMCCLENDFTLPEARGHEGMVERTLRCIQAAAQCGATQVRLLAGTTPAGKMTPAVWERMLAGFRRCDEACREMGLVIALETRGRIRWQAEGCAVHESTVTTERQALARLMQALPVTVGFNFDPANLKAAEPGDRRLGLDLLNDKVRSCHMKDWRRTGAGWEAVGMGEDDLEYGALLGRMKYRGVYWIDYPQAGDVVEGIKRSLGYLARLGRVRKGAASVSGTMRG